MLKCVCVCERESVRVLERVGARLDSKLCVSCLMLVLCLSSVSREMSTVCCSMSMLCVMCVVAHYLTLYLEITYCYCPKAL